MDVISRRQPQRRGRDLLTTQCELACVHIPTAGINILLCIRESSTRIPIIERLNNSMSENSSLHVRALAFLEAEMDADVPDLVQAALRADRRVDLSGSALHIIDIDLQTRILPSSLHVSSAPAMNPLCSENTPGPPKYGARAPKSRN